MATTCEPHRAGATDVLTGAAIGAIGGLIAGFMMNRAHALFSAGKEAVTPAAEPGIFESGGPRREAATHEPATSQVAEDLAQAVIDRPLSHDERRAGGLAIHYAFSVGCGAIYGALASAFPTVGKSRGLAAGATIWVLADEVAMPALGYTKPPQNYPFHKHVQSLINHLVFGFVTDSIHRLACRRPR
jgi:putative membrane protein